MITKNFSHEQFPNGKKNFLTSPKFEHEANTRFLNYDMAATSERKANFFAYFLYYIISSGHKSDRK